MDGCNDDDCHLPSGLGGCISNEEAQHARPRSFEDAGRWEAGRGTHHIFGELPDQVTGSVALPSAFSVESCRQLQGSGLDVCKMFPSEFFCVGAITLIKHASSQDHYVPEQPFSLRTCTLRVPDVSLSTSEAGAAFISILTLTLKGRFMWPSTWVRNTKLSLRHSFLNWLTWATCHEFIAADNPL